jgi:hypothetical protein
VKTNRDLDVKHALTPRAFLKRVTRILELTAEQVAAEEDASGATLITVRRKHRPRKTDEA